MDMTDRLLVESLCKREISIEDFRLKTSFRASKDELISLLKDACERCNLLEYNQVFNVIFWELPKDVLLDEKKDIYREFLLNVCHNEHDQIAIFFQTHLNKDVENIPVLLSALKDLPPYLSEDDFKYPYIRKLIYAIGAQPEPYNIEALEKLVNETDDNKIKELALHQIEKRRRMGRWEAAKRSEESKT